MYSIYDKLCTSMMPPFLPSPSSGALKLSSLHPCTDYLLPQSLYLLSEFHSGYVPTGVYDPPPRFLAKPERKKITYTT